jgi:signal transduction histidine kinase
LRRFDTIYTVTAGVIEDPWQARLDRMRRILPLPLLAVSTAIAMATPADGSHSWARFQVGIPVTAAAALWWALVGARLRSDSSTARRLVVFTVHTALAGVLVWVDRSYGVFAYSGFLFAYGLGRRWRLPGFAAIALIVSAALSGGYPSADVGQILTYLMVAAVMLALVLTSASITSRAVDQNQERGRMITELAEAKRQLEASMAENADLHAKLLIQARETGILDERQRLAGEIHDTLAQGLTGIIAQLGAAEHVRDDPRDLSRHLELAQSLARSSLTEARRSVQALRPEQLEGASLPDAIAALARTWSQQSTITAELHTTGGQASAGTAAEDALYRVAQEGLSNVAKHAKATKVRLTLTYLEDTLLLDVVDNGTGFDPAAGTDGYGLIGMQHRLARVGGTLTVEASPGYGTTLNAAVPLGGAPE